MSQIDLDDIDEEAEEDVQSNMFLTFNLGKESYGIEIRYVTEIIVMQEITTVPDMPEFIIGVINLRGNVISIMDIRKRFKLESKEYNDRTCIIVVDINNIMVGLVVDTVSEVLNIPEEEVDPPPQTHSGIKSNYIMGMGKTGKQVRILLDIGKILYEEELEQVQQMQ